MVYLFHKIVDLSSSQTVNVSHNQRVNLHFPMVFLWFSYGFPFRALGWARATLLFSSAISSRGPFFSVGRGVHRAKVGRASVFFIENWLAIYLYIYTLYSILYYILYIILYIIYIYIIYIYIWWYIYIYKYIHIITYIYSNYHTVEEIQPLCPYVFIVVYREIATTPNLLFAGERPCDYHGWPVLVRSSSLWGRNATIYTWM